MSPSIPPSSVFLDWSCVRYSNRWVSVRIRLSLGSRKISIQISNDRFDSQKVIVDLGMLNQKIIVCTENSKDTFLVSIHLDFSKSRNSNDQHSSIACCTGTVVSTQNGIRTYWKNYREGFISVIQLLLKMFQCKISTSFICHCSKLFQPTISKLFDLQLEFKMFCLKGSNDENVLWNQISNKLGLVECLRIFSNTTNPGFKPVITSWPQEISILGSDWFTVEFLLACTCTTITLEESHLENKEMDKILREWRAGGLPNLKHLTIGSLNLTDNGEQILGINLNELNGMVIQTDDGSKTAAIEFNQHWIQMSVTPV
ncbi:hypothetical protein CRE_31522 [Caenorhabditis remanei]|uniref:Sdz-33 F-box domain-containing protein n=1 Tax=Caenorhabditis remanei TaxID=31234 RepID=E3NGG4_CAERE|nr:hypothetical protein CRE_31522 [Caenorhabditis remanei]